MQATQAQRVKNTWIAAARTPLVLVLFLLALPANAATAEQPAIALGLGAHPTIARHQYGWFQQRETVRQAILLELEERGHSTIDGVYETIPPEAFFIRPECIIDHEAHQVDLTLYDIEGNEIAAATWGFDPYWPTFAKQTHQARSTSIGPALTQAGLPPHQPRENSEVIETPLNEEAWWQQPTLPRILGDLQQLSHTSGAQRDTLWYQRASRRWADLGRIAEMAYGSLHQICKARAMLLALAATEQSPSAEAQETLAFALVMSGYPQAARSLTENLLPPIDAGGWQQATRILATWDLGAAEQTTNHYAERRARWLLVTSWLTRWNTMNMGWRRAIRKALLDCSPHPTYAIGQRSTNNLGNHQEFVNILHENWTHVASAPALPQARDPTNFFTSLAAWPAGAERPWALAKRIIEDLNLQIAFAQVRKTDGYLKAPQDLSHLVPIVGNHRFRGLLELYGIDPHNDTEEFSNLIWQVTPYLPESSTLLLPSLLKLDSVLWTGEEKIDKNPKNQAYHGSGAYLRFDADKGTDSTARLAHYRIYLQNNTLFWQRWWPTEVEPVWRREGDWPTAVNLARNLHSYSNNKAYRQALQNPRYRQLQLAALINEQEKQKKTQ
jgi:hypothetical protein